MISKRVSEGWMEVMCQYLCFLTLRGRLEFQRTDEVECFAHSEKERNFLFLLRNLPTQITAALIE